MQAIKMVDTKSKADPHGYLMEYSKVPHMYTRRVQQLGAQKPKKNVFASRQPRSRGSARGVGTMGTMRCQGFVD